MCIRDSHYYDSVIDQQTYRQHHAKHRQRVDGVAKHRQYREGAQQHQDVYKRQDPVNLYYSLTLNIEP